MGRRALALVFGLGAFAAFGGDPAAPIAVAHAEESAESCLSFRKSSIEKGIAFDVESSCEMKLACKVSWVVLCSDNDGKVESKTPKSERFGLANGETHELTLSAASCKQSWKVEDVRWGCDPVKK